MERIVVVLGQTATGKSDLAVKLAKQFNGEIISADSRQVYKGLNIGTGKITKKEMGGVPHYLLDVANPKRKFTVAQYKKIADKEIGEIIKKGKLPIIAGGTGFYIDAVVKGLILPEVPPNPKLRKSLHSKPAIAIFEYLKKLDPVRAKTIDRHNKVRLIRAIEIAKALGKVPKLKTRPRSYEFIKIGLSLPPQSHNSIIEKRVENMFRKGLLREIKKLKRSGVTEKRLKEFGFEYNSPTLESVLIGTKKYAKRQMTWFKRDPEIHWFTPKDYKKISAFLEKEGLKKLKPRR